MMLSRREAGPLQIAGPVYIAEREMFGAAYGKVAAIR
jgi:hypothetical protein